MSTRATTRPWRRQPSGGCGSRCRRAERDGSPAPPPPAPPPASGRGVGGVGGSCGGRRGEPAPPPPCRAALGPGPDLRLDVTGGGHHRRTTEELPAGLDHPPVEVLHGPADVVLG